jgi:hypothetical protein
MRILGVDPSPTGIAWAIYDDQIRKAVGVCAVGYRSDIVAWGSGLNWCDECRAEVCGGRPSRWDYAAIETITARRAGPISSAEIQTAFTIGIWWDRLGTNTLLLDRSTIRAALKVGHGASDPQVNCVMAKLCPALDGVRKGLDSHHRAAAAVALVAAGRINMPVAAQRKAGA